VVEAPDAGSVPHVLADEGGDGGGALQGGQVRGVIEIFDAGVRQRVHIGLGVGAGHDPVACVPWITSVGALTRRSNRGSLGSCR